MSYPHVIRLRGPWDYEVLVAESAEPSSRKSGRAQLPGDWHKTLGREFCGTVRFTRSFNRPTNLDAHERVWLAIDGVDARGSLALNGQPLGSIDGYALPVRHDVTELLALANRLEITVELPADDQALRPGRTACAGGILGEVTLEICASLCVAGLSLHWERVGDVPQLVVAGTVRGTHDGGSPSLALSACERELAYAPVKIGESFRVVAPVADWPVWPDPMDEPVLTPVEIRLIHGPGAMWQAAYETAPPQADSASPRAQMLLQADQSVAWHDYLQPADGEFDRLVATSVGKVLGLRAVLSPAAYHALDRANVGVVQFVPAAWAETVCPLLARHPSILRWATTSVDHLPTTLRDAAGLTCGRAWREM